MLFSSIPFLYYFLPCVLTLYFIVPKQMKNGVLFLSSLVFYGWGEPKYLIFMLISITQGYFLGILIEKYRGTKRSKFFLAVSVILSLFMLGYFKYTDFFISNVNAVTGLSIPLLKVTLPIGISFYTFQILSYSVDVYRNEVKAQKNYLDLATYIAMFPQLVAGPIVRYSEIEKQLKSRIHTVENTAKGIRRFLIGLAKKILIANLLGQGIALFQASDSKSVLFCWLYAISYMLHIYFDFSGYSDMAIGLGQILGFHFPENFNYPYVSKSITEFWRRWHISLGSWFRDYLYIPLGGNRVGKARWFLNIFLVWAATGFWHGAQWTFILWGILFAILLIIEKMWLLPFLKKAKVFNHLYVLSMVAISFVIFDAPSITQAFSLIADMFGAGGLPFISLESVYYLQSYGVILILASIGATPIVKKLLHSVKKKKFLNAILQIAEPIFLVILLALCTAFLVDGSFNPFLYFRF